VFTYKGKQVKVQQVAKELGVNYVLEGSVRKVGNHVRITTQLVDADTGHHIWATNFDREIENIFTLQDEITGRIATTLQPELAGAEEQRSSAKAPKDLRAWDYFQRGSHAYWKYTLEANSQALKLFEQAIEVDPAYSPAFTGLALAHHAAIVLGAPGARELAPRKMLEAAKRAVALDDDDARAHLALSFGLHRTNQPELAIAEARKSIELNPSNPLSHGLLGSELDFFGSPQIAISCFQAALALTPPSDQLFFLQAVARIRLHAGDYEGAVAEARRAISARPGYAYAYVVLAAGLAHLDRPTEAREALARGEAIDHGFVEKWHEWPLYHLDEQKQLVIDGLLKAGWKGDPSQLPSPWRPDQDT